MSVIKWPCHFSTFSPETRSSAFSFFPYQTQLAFSELMHLIRFIMIVISTSAPTGAAAAVSLPVTALCGVISPSVARWVYGTGLPPPLRLTFIAHQSTHRWWWSTYGASSPLMRCALLMKAIRRNWSVKREEEKKNAYTGKHFRTALIFQSNGVN